METRVIKEASKRSLSIKDYWSPLPKGYKGNRMQFVQHSKECKKQEFIEKHECDAEKKKKAKQEHYSKNHQNHGSHEGLCPHALMAAQEVCNTNAIKTDFGNNFKKLFRKVSKLPE